MRDMMLLVEPEIPGLRRYARALLRDPSQADDLVQDCLERAVSRWSQRRDEGSVRAWLFTILHNLAINRLHQRRRRGPQLPLDAVAESALSEPAGQEAAAGQADVLKALAGLPEDQRSVLLLVSVEDLSYAETAKALGVPVGTVMSRLSRARERLRLDLSREGPSTGAYLRRVK